MALTKTIVDDKIEIVTEFKHLQIRTATVIKEDGVELSRSYHLKVLHCGNISGDSNTWSETDISGESTEVQALAALLWTTSVKNDYKQSLLDDLAARS